MKRKFSKIRLTAVVLCLASVFSVVLAEPGGQDDPLISKNYIETVLMPQIKQYVESKISEVSSSGTAAAESFKIVNMTSGQKLICSSGCELILRMGKATVIATEKGGLADTTAGFDLSNGTDMPANHLLIVPVNDGRGIEAKNDVIVMVKGGYTLK